MQDTTQSAAPSTPRVDVPATGGRVVAGRYCLEHHLGSGGFGQVWRAIDSLSGDPVAVKLLSLAGERELSRFRDEVALLRLLDLPGVVHLLDDGVDDGIPFLVTELIDGAEFPGPGLAIPVEWDEIAPVVETLLETLARVHAHGVIHRDLKPANVMVRSDGRPVILDFGVSWGPGFTADEGDRSMAGTPAYLAPEQALGRRGDERTDIYALGAMLYEALSGRLPHRARGITELVRQKIDEKPAPLAAVAPEVPQRVALVVDQMLNTLASSRPDGAATVLELLGGRGVRSQLRRLGGTDLVDGIVARLLDGRSTTVYGRTGSGRTRLAADVAERLRAEGREVVEVRMGARAFSSIGAPWNRIGLDLSRTERVAALAEALVAAGAIVVADDGDDLDTATLAVLARAGSAIPVMLLTGDRSAADTTIPPLRESDLRELFHGPDRILHLVEDGARELARRTDGRPKTVLNVLDAWERSGLCYWEGERVRIDRVTLDRLAAGLQVHSRRASALLSDLPTRHAMEVAEWVRLAGDAATTDIVRTASGLDELAISAAVDELRRAGVVRSEEGRLLLMDTLPREQRWEPAKLRAAHEKLAAAMAPGTPGRFAHLLRVGDVRSAVDEAVSLARHAEFDGRYAGAVTTLIETLQLATRNRYVEGLRPVLTELAIAALSTHARRPLDLALYHATRAEHAVGPHTAETARLVGLLEVARLVRFVEQSAGRSLDACLALPPFDDPRLERWRRALRFSCGYAVDVKRHAAFVEDDAAWAATTGDDEIVLAVEDWRGLVLYRRAEFEAAAAAHGRARRESRSAYRRVIAGLNEANALIETGDTASAAVVALEAADEAANVRSPDLELRGIRIHRLARYRGGEDLTPDLELVEIATLFEGHATAPLVVVSEAVNAWRAGSRDLAASLCRRAFGMFMQRTILDGAMLAAALSGCDGRLDLVHKVPELLASGAGHPSVRRQARILSRLPDDPAERSAPVVDFRTPRLDVLSRAELHGGLE